MDGVTYSGDFIDGQFHGRGVYTFAEESGKVYEGEFYENEIHGKGVMRWADGSVYTGAFVKGRMEGYGEWTAADGSYYKGFWKNDMRHGENGQAFDAQSSGRIQGQWLNDVYQDMPLGDKSPWGRMRKFTHTKRLVGITDLP